jgi:hypothetical protein
MEANGVPTVTLANSPYERTHYYSAIDNGIMHARRALVDRMLNARQYMLHGINFSDTPEHRYFGGEMSLSERNIRLMRFLTERMFNGEHADPIMQNHVIIENPLAPPFGTDPIANNNAVFGPYRYIHRQPVITQVIWALTAPLTAEEADPTPLEDIPAAMYALGGVNPPTERLVTIPTNGNAIRAFNEWAVRYSAHDGTTLVIPTVERVNAMLAATERSPDDVLGNMKMRGGVMEIRTIAANAVMAGASPEHFPVILAALEVKANGWDDDMTWFHAQSSGLAVAIWMIVSGPIAEELGISGARGYASEHANRVIGRAFRLNVRNVGHSSTPDIDTTGRFGRGGDLMTIVVAEQASELPSGWLPHHVLKGFDANQSTVSLVGLQEKRFGDHERMGGEPFAWAASDVLQNLRNSILNNATTVFLIPPAMAHEFRYEQGFDTKAAFLAHVRSLPLQNSDSPGNFFRPGNPATTGDPHANQRNVWTLVAGGDPNVPQTLAGWGLYGHNLFGTQLIGGARLSSTRAATDPTVPSAPRDFRVIHNENGSYTLAWNAPASSGGPGIQVLGYEVTFVHGGTTQSHHFVNTPTIYHGPDAVTILGGTQPAANHFTRNPNQIVYMTRATARAHAIAEGLPETYAFTFADEHILPGFRAFFRVRARNAMLENHGTTAAAGAGFNVPLRLGSIRNSVTLMGAPNASAQNTFNLRSSGRGGWTQTIIVDKPGVFFGINPHWEYLEYRAANPLPPPSDDDSEYDEYTYVELECCEYEYCECYIPNTQYPPDEDE